jgi:hypothetical protein
MKRSVKRKGWAPHPHLTSDDLNDWEMLNVSGSEQRWKLMRFKNCPKCGTVTQKCGCPSNNIVCNGLDKCPNEGMRRAMPLIPYNLSFVRSDILLQHAITCNVLSAAHIGTTMLMFT